MNTRPNDTAANAEKEAVSQEARLFTEILSRMDAQKGDQTTPPQETARTIDLVELFFFLLSKLHFIVLGAVIGALLLGVYGSSRTVPIYSATAKLYIIGDTNISIISDIQIGTVLTMDFQEVFNTWEVHQMVNEQLGMHYTYSQLQAMLTVENPEDTRVLYITIRNPDPELASDIANAYVVAAKRFITQTMQMDEPRTFSVALVPSVASVTSVTDWVIRGILLGTALAGGVLVLLFLLDNRPRSPEDILHAADLHTLAVVPIYDERAKHSEVTKHGNQKKHGGRKER